MRQSLILLVGMALVLLVCSGVGYAFSQDSDISIEFEEIYYPYTGATREVEATVTVQESGGLTGQVTVTGPGTITPSTFTLPENGSYSKTIQVTLPKDAGEYTYTAISGRINGTEMRDEEKVTVFAVEITHSPQYWVPGHDNEVRYRIYPDEYVAAYGLIEIFERDANDRPTGQAIYSSSDFSLEGGEERSFVYEGSDISHDPGSYILILRVGQSATNYHSDEAIFDVQAWNLIWFVWDELQDEDITATETANTDLPEGYDPSLDPFNESDPAAYQYCSGINHTTVTSTTVSMQVWYHDESENEATAITINSGTSTKSISDEDWVSLWKLDLTDKPWYDERGSCLVKLNNLFYTMDDTNQFFYLKITILENGVLDNAENLFDGDLSTTQRENIITYKVRINSDRTVDILDEDYGVQ